MTAIGLNIRIPRQSLIMLKDYHNKKLVVKFNGGRVIEGTLRSWDKGLNMVLDNTIECKYLGDKQVESRELGMIIVKGSQIYSIGSKNGYELIDNPFLSAQEQQEQQKQQKQQEQQK